ncbi:hypothetical protein E2C01_016925 [Portunus trituberculatus]|uniref:Uncharacterized protein n=1 Tax=Portunus trituberculatus TaxID=210409 RepID=A0A5B7DR24_PORTR|nr:hypothetical protein [Portunus trituberculatus]
MHSWRKDLSSPAGHSLPPPRPAPPRPPLLSCNTAPFHFRYVRKITNGHLSAGLPGQGCDVIKWAGLAQVSSAACV